MTKRKYKEERKKIPEKYGRPMSEIPDKYLKDKNGCWIWLIDITITAIIIKICLKLIFLELIYQLPLI